jgi:hypothetical protein
MLAQAHGWPGSRPAGRSPVVLHPNASHDLVPPYVAVTGLSPEERREGRTHIGGSASLVKLQ